MEPAHTHRPLLRLAVEATMGPVLELGIGEGSTPFLHELVADKGRLLVSMDNDAAWVARYAHLADDDHVLLHVPVWSALRLPLDLPGDGMARRPVARWSVVLVDHAPAHRRATDALRLARHATYLVLHDTEDLSYGWDRVLPWFPYQFTDASRRPWTSLVSLVSPVPLPSLPRSRS